MNMDGAPTNSDSATICPNTGDLLAWSDRRRANGVLMGASLVDVVNALPVRLQRVERDRSYASV